MTRNDFLNDVTEWWELLDFCSDEGCNICEDIIDSDQLDEYVEEDIRDTNYSWRDIRDSLSEIPTGYGYYRMNGSFDYDGMDENDFDSYKEDVLEWGDNNGVWEDEPDEEDDFDTDAMFNEEDSEPDEPPVEEEDFSIGELMGFCGVVLLDIRHLRIHFLYRLDSLRVLKAGNWGYDGMRDAMAGHSGSNDLNAPAHVQSGATANMHVNIYYFAH